MSGIRIIATGSYLPEKRLSNFDLEKMVDTSDEWITTRTGIKERRIASDNEATSDLAYKALQNLAEKCDFDLKLIDVLIVATGTPDRLFPSSAARLHGLLGLKKETASFDILAACAGFSYAFEIARSFSASGYEYIAIVGSEVLSKFVDWTDRSTCVLFGDGAGAIVFKRIPDNNILYSRLYTNGKLDNLLEIPAGGSLLPPFNADPAAFKIKMAGREVFKHAVNELSMSVEKALMSVRLSPSDIEAVFAHQANLRIINAVLERVGIPPKKAFNNIAYCGNTSAASIPILIDEYNKRYGLKKGSVYLIFSFGAGFVWGVHIYEHR